MTLYPRVGEIARWNASGDENSTGSGPLYEPIGDYDGTLQNGAAIIADTDGGEFAKRAVSFDATNYAEIASVDLLGASNDITISVWVKPDPVQESYANIVDHNHSGSNGNWVIQQDNLNHNSYYFAFNYTASAFDGLSKTTTLTAGQWNHFLIIKNGTSLDHYLDGVKQGSTLTVQANIDAKAAILRIGANVSMANRDFSGDIDDLRIYDTAIDQAEVDWLYNSGLGRGRNEAVTNAPMLKSESGRWGVNAGRVGVM